MERKNSWQLAEVAGFDAPDRFQHLLGRGAWAADALRDEQLGVVRAGLGEEDALLAIDETGFVKQGKKRVVAFIHLHAKLPTGHTTLSQILQARASVTLPPESQRFLP